MADTELSRLFFFSGGLIFLAMVFDALDGFAARLTKSASDFGGQLDSLCDAVSFGAAPAFLLLKLTQEWQHPPLVRKVVGVIAALYMICAILRLARFNLENAPDPNAHKRFKGLPSPAAAGCVASLAILRTALPFHGFAGLSEEIVLKALLVFAPAGTLAVALLMVSRIAFPHFVNQLFAPPPQLRRRRAGPPRPLLPLPRARIGPLPPLLGLRPLRPPPLRPASPRPLPAPALSAGDPGPPYGDKVTR